MRRWQRCKCANVSDARESGQTGSGAGLRWTWIFPFSKISTIRGGGNPHIFFIFRRESAALAHFFRARSMHRPPESKRFGRFFFRAIEHTRTHYLARVASQQLRSGAEKKYGKNFRRGADAPGGLPRHRTDRSERAEAGARPEGVGIQSGRGLAGVTPESVQTIKISLSPMRAIRQGVW